MTTEQLHLLRDWVRAEIAHARGLLFREPDGSSYQDTTFERLAESFREPPCAACRGRGQIDAGFGEAARCGHCRGGNA